MIGANQKRSVVGNMGQLKSCTEVAAKLRGTRMLL